MIKRYNQESIWVKEEARDGIPSLIKVMATKDNVDATIMVQTSLCFSGWCKGNNKV